MSDLPSALGLHPAGRIVLQLGEVQMLGPMGNGTRRVSLIEGGTAEGPLIGGEVLKGGSDWQLIRADGVAEIDARFMIRRPDGALLSVRNQGYRHGPPEVMAALARGDAVAPDAYYFNSVIWIETPADAAGSLGRTVIVATAERMADQVRITLATLGSRPA